MNYTALTIGPIYKTILRMKKVREIWGASYIFSKFMRLTIKHLIEKGISKDGFLVPYIDDELLENNNPDFKGIGFFHDRLIFETPHGKSGLDILNKAIEDTLKIISKDIQQDKYTKVSCDDIKDFLKKYLLYYAIEIDLEPEQNPILEISPYLDTLELRTRVEPIENSSKPNYFIEYLLNHGNTLRYDANYIKEEAGGCVKYSFPSIPQITINDIFKQSNQKQKIIEIFQQECKKEILEESIFEKLKSELNITLKPYHKYIAIVHADGDSMGEEIKQAYTKQNSNGLKEFSKNLINFSKNAVKKLSQYGAQPVYIGGDDLLFFAPIFSKLEDNSSVTIFNLLDELDSLFKEQFKDSNANVSLSFGVSITYYKYPMVEALEKSYETLAYRAKNISKNKNAISIEVIKHSGQSFKYTMSKKDKSYTLFSNLLLKNLSNKIKIPHALHHKLSSLEEVLCVLLKKGDKLENFFENFFNEDIHKKEFSKGLNEVRELLLSIYKEMTDEKSKLLDIQKSDTHIKSPSVYMLFSLLSTIKLLRGDE